MKEIDLLPEWYKSSRRRQIGYWAQYTVLGVVFAVIVMWSLVGFISISKTEKEIASLESVVLESRRISEEFRGIESEIERLEKKANVIAKVDSRIDVAGRVDLNTHRASNSGAMPAGARPRAVQQCGHRQRMVLPRFSPTGDDVPEIRAVNHHRLHRSL